MNLFSENLNFSKENILYNIPDGIDCYAVFELLKFSDINIHSFKKN